MYDYEYTSLERGNFSKLVFVNWCAVRSARAAPMFDDAAAATHAPFRRAQTTEPTQTNTHKQTKRARCCCCCSQQHQTPRAPDTAVTRTKMMYASTKDFLKGFLDGVNSELQATEPAELGEEDMRERVVSNMTRK